MANMPPAASSYGHRITIAGGDMDLELGRAGWTRNRPACFAVTEKPQLLGSAYAAFLDAGVEIVVTCTPAANAIQCESLGIASSELWTMNRTAAQVCRAAVDHYPAKDRSAWGLVGPVDLLLTLGEIKEPQLAEAYRQQAAALVEGGVQGIICRHFTELDALRITIEAVRSACELPIIAGLSFGSGPDLGETPLGISVAQACDVLKNYGLSAVAVDSGRHPDGLGQVIAATKANTDLPIWATCDAGHLQMHEEGLRYSDSPADFAARYQQLAAAGVSFFEGGGGASCIHMASVSSARKAYKPRASRAVGTPRPGIT